MTVMDDSARIATLTSDAIRASGDKTIADIRERLGIAEDMAKALREEGEEFIDTLAQRTLSLTDHIGSYVAFCKETAEMFKTAGESVKAINGNGALTDVADQEIDKLKAIISTVPVKTK